MSEIAVFSEVATAAGDPARAGMLDALMDGRALTASELGASPASRRKPPAAIWRA